MLFIIESLLIFCGNLENVIPTRHISMEHYGKVFELPITEEKAKLLYSNLYELSTFSKAS